jgi:hypothetical protein
MNPRERFLNAVKVYFDDQKDTISASEIKDVMSDQGVSYPAWLVKDQYRVYRGVYRLPTLEEALGKVIPHNVQAPSEVMENVVAMKTSKVHPSHVVMEDLTPEKDPNYVSWGFHTDLKNIIKSKAFYPIFVFGESGFGKNMMIEQVCAELKREMIRINFSIETDKTDLVGGPTLENGNVVYNEGPVLTAMRKGAVLFMDEFSKGNPNNMLVLNGILEGKPFFNPHTGELVHAKEGFNIIAASNSAGRGEDTGRFLEQILDSSLLERFPVTVIQEPPTDKVIVRILSRHLEDNDFIEKLVKWQKVIQKTFENGGIDELISIRRLVHIANAYKIFNDKLKAIGLCTNRFDTATRESFIDLYKKIDAGVNVDEEPSEPSEEVRSPF